jgi:hypothetical protein
MLSEFGHMSLKDSTVDDDVLGSEVRHANILKEAYEAFADLPELKGYSPWCLVDIRAPIHWRWYNQGTGLFRYGVMDENYEKKEKVFSTLADAIAKLKKINAAR